MDGDKIGNILKVIGAIAIFVVVMKACSSNEGKYSPPDPVDYNSMRQYKKDKSDYDKAYKEARDDAIAEQNNEWL
jgi:hypothetical protein